jgi:6-pyruvoyl-tetrahydropterin synthase
MVIARDLRLVMPMCLIVFSLLFCASVNRWSTTTEQNRPTTTMTMAQTSPVKKNTTSFEVFVAKDTFKFNAAHFVAFAGFRERLHGHNYRVSVRLLGERKIGADGYVIDFGNVKDVCKAVCKKLNEHFLCPIHSDVLTITENDADKSVRIECEDGTFFVFPIKDCAMLPLVHATAEELSIYLWAELLKGLDAAYLIKRGIHTMEITVAEAPGQEAVFRLEIPEPTDTEFSLDVRTFITKGDVVPMPCLDKPKKEACCADCQTSKKALSDQLVQLAQALNDGGAQQGTVSAETLEALLNKH